FLGIARRPCRRGLGKGIAEPRHPFASLRNPAMLALLEGLGMYKRLVVAALASAVLSACVGVLGDFTVGDSDGGIGAIDSGSDTTVAQESGSSSGDDGSTTPPDDGATPPTEAGADAGSALLVINHPSYDFGGVLVNQTSAPAGFVVGNAGTAMATLSVTL